MRKRPILRLSVVSPCRHWAENSLTFLAGGLHVGQVHDLLELAQHRRFGLRETSHDTCHGPTHKKEPSRGVQREGRVSSLVSVELLGDLHGFLDLFEQVDLSRVAAHVAEHEPCIVFREQASNAGSCGPA